MQRQPSQVIEMAYLVNDAEFKELTLKIERHEAMVETALSFSMAAGAIMFSLFVIEAVAMSLRVFRYFYPVTFKRLCIPTPREVDTDNPPPTSSSKEAGVWQGLP